MARKVKKAVVGSVALYGAWQYGYGYLASDGKRIVGGNGELDKRRGLNDAYWLGVTDLQAAGIGPGLVEVHEPNGQRMALVDLDAAPLPYFGDLTWQPAPVYTISYEEIMAVAEAQAAKGGAA